MEEYPFLKPYAKPSRDAYIISPGIPKVKVELFYIEEEELYYPNILEIISCHSGRHSLAMFIKEGVLNQVNKGRQLGLYTRPRTTHPGDREFTHYFFSQFEFPHVILTRLENLSWLLQVNGLMKQAHFGKGGRWCTRIWKTEPILLFYQKYFHSWKYKFTNQELIQYCKKYKIHHYKSWKKSRLITAIEKRLNAGMRGWAKKIPPPNKTKHGWNKIKYPIYRWSPTMKEWAAVDTITNRFPIYRKKVKMVGTSPRHIGWEQTGEMLQLTNIFQSLGINKYHSKKRRMQNPNFVVHPKSRPKSNFIIFSRHPLYEETPTQMIELINSSPIELEENPFEREHPLAYTQNPKVKEEDAPSVEERFGCIICPYRSLKYYENLRAKYPWQYFYCMAIRLVASAKKIIREGKEYWYEGADIKNPIMRI